MFATAEYLASHGYVVLQAPRIGAAAGVHPDAGDARDLDNKLKDMDVLVNVASALPFADTDNMATIAFSAGGRWALAGAMKYPGVRAVVSLDSVRVPVLHLQSKAFAQRDDLKMWDALRYADRTYLVYEEPKLVHWDFQSLGYATALAGARGDAAPEIAEAYHAWSRETLAFRDAHLKGGTYKQPATAKRTAALPAPITVAEFLNAVAEEGTDAAIAAYRGDAYLAAGDRAKALEATKKANALLAGDKGLTPERRAAIQGSIDGKLRQLQ